MKVFFTSDTHFHHQNILHKYCPERGKRWKSVEEMNQGLIDLWNSRVDKNDIVYHLGDFTLTTRVELIDPILEQLNGRIRLVRGNHDKWLRRLDDLKHADKFDWVRQYNKENFTVDGRSYEIVMMHFPFLSWDGSARGSIHVHGHAHGGNDHLNRGTKRIDVGVDAEHTLMGPISLDLVVKISLDGNATDHHDL